jgi:ADP-glucose pyrophosphorylase
VTVERGSVIRDSTLSHSIVGAGCTLTGATLTQSMLGDQVVLRDFRGTASLADHSELTGSG